MLRLGISPQYVLDEITTYEIKALLENQYQKDKESWEQARLISFIIAQSNSKKKLKLEDIIKFSWDSKQDKKEAQAMSEADLKRLKANAQKFIENNTPLT